jgi:hypothetical protein
MSRKTPHRVWYYNPIYFKPRWWRQLGVPWLSDDEYGRRTLAWGTGITGYLFWAYRTCQCEDCVDITSEAQLEHQHEEDLKIYEELKVKFSEEFADEVVQRRVHLRELQKRRA